MYQNKPTPCSFRLQVFPTLRKTMKNFLVTETLAVLVGLIMLYQVSRLVKLLFSLKRDPLWAKGLC